MVETNNLRIVASEDVLSPQEVKDRAGRPDESTTQHILQSRDTIARIMNGDNKRMLVVTGPCSIHTEESAYAYAEVVKEAQKFENLVIVMRAYFEKPRTTIGWKGLINDPHLDDSFDINHGLILARQIYMKLAEMRIPIGIEQLDTLSPQYLSDLVSWSAIGARTAESQPHRELSSGLSSPVGIKNGTSGDLEIAINAMKAASKPHHFLSIGEEGTIKRFTTSGNPDTHIILRGGGDDEQNYELSHQQETAALLRDAGFDERRIIVDASHKNAPGGHLDQITVVNYMISQILAGKNLARGLMLEGHIQEGRQDIKNGKNNPLKSITDPCIGKDDTLDQLDRLNDTVGQMTS